jgi:uncharacterized membrane protein YphA (DoxX/SURF4 family)
MTTDTPPRASSRHGTRTTAYWVATGLIAAEALAGGTLDLIRFDSYLSTLIDLGYPAYLATILGTAKVVAGIVVLAPRLPRLKEWAYAGILVNMLGAAASHVLAGRPFGNVVPPLALALVALASWATRPGDRRLAGPAL